MKNIKKDLYFYGSLTSEACVPTAMPQEPLKIRHKAKKNTRKWCKGRTGVTHLWTEWEKMFPTLEFSRLLERHCLECGKKDVSFEKKIDKTLKTC